MAFHPQFTQAGALVQELLDAVHVLHPPNPRIAVRGAVEHAYVVRPEWIDEERRMGGDDELSAIRSLLALLCQLGQQTWVQVVLWFLDPDEPTGYYIEEIIEGTAIVQALGSVQYEEGELKRQMKAQVDEAIKTDRMKPSEAMRLLDDYERGLKEYTYLTI